MSATIAGYCQFQLLSQVNYTLTYFAEHRLSQKKFTFEPEIAQVVCADEILLGRVEVYQWI
jgi:hypothetical protein